MRIEYKKPYWIKFKWDLSSHHDNQYVTEFNKSDNSDFENLFLNDFTISVEFKIKPEYKKDTICMVFGKPGKNMGLTYNEESKCVAFEFWTSDEKFHFLNLKGVEEHEIHNGIIVTIQRIGQTIILYKNFEIFNTYEFSENFADDYKILGLYLGCSSPQSENENTRYYGEMDIEFFTIIKNQIKIDDVKTIHEIKTQELCYKPFYNDILCIYNFNTINNLGIVYDESKNTNFLEKVPKEFIS